MNAPRPLDIATPDGSGQAVHPDVVEIPSGFGGYRFWMACTPYPGGNDRLENPIIRASHDGVVWVVPDGTPDPLLPAPPSATAHHADPDLVYWANRLYLYFMTTEKSERATTFSVMSSTDGRSWSDPEPVYRGTWGVSPAVVATASSWFMWHVVLDTSAGFAGARVMRQTATGPAGFGEAVECRMDIPGHVPWHLDVIAGGGFEALVAAFPAGTDTSRTRLFHMVSRDGLEFEPSPPGPILKPRALRWDGRMIYRATFTRPEADRLRIWYSAGSWDRRFGIGLVEGPPDGLRPVVPGAPSIRERGTWAAGFVRGYLRHAIRRILPERFVRRGRALRGPR